jgi:curved DNA-binding protein CbpA
VGLAGSPGRREKLCLRRLTDTSTGGLRTPSERALPDYYFVLGVPPDATAAEIHGAWRRQLRYWHPDRGNHPDALEHSKLINEAHDVLSDADRRQIYDRKRKALGWRPPNAGTTRAATRVMQWKVVPHEGPFKSYGGFDFHGFVGRLEELMERGRLMIEKRKDLASAAKWEAQTLALLHDQLGDHPYTRAFEEALKQENGRVGAYGILWAAYEDALKGDLRPATRKSGGRAGS